MPRRDFSNTGALVLHDASMEGLLPVAPQYDRVLEQTRPADPYQLLLYDVARSLVQIERFGAVIGGEQTPAQLQERAERHRSACTSYVVDRIEQYNSLHPAVCLQRIIGDAESNIRQLGREAALPRPHAS